ncbi:MAG: FG-GAP repeat protein [Planctomycetes bacterium]|nr:FG-GAP repeat protein [Planctomycetota bacterium]
MKRIVFSVCIAVSSAPAFAQELAQLSASDAGPSDYFGQAVAIDGDTVVVGAGAEDVGFGNTGAVYVYVGAGSSWTEQAKLVAADRRAGDRLGCVVAVQADRLVASAWGDDLIDGSLKNEGSAYVFERTGTTWTQAAKLFASDAATGDMFGLSAALDGDTIVVGVPYRDDLGPDAGAAYVFVRSGGSWVQEAKLTAGDGAFRDHFGMAVAVSGDTAVVGAYRHDHPQANCGAAYVFVRSAGVWTQQAELTAADAAQNDMFGQALALVADRVAVGAPSDDDLGTNSGSCYVFDRVGTSWTQSGKLHAADGGPFDGLGRSLALSGSLLVIAATDDNHAGPGAGSAYAFWGNGAAWTQTAKLVAGEATTGDFFGQSVGVSGSSIVAGSSGDDDGGMNSGSAHVFRAGAPVTTYCTAKTNSLGCTPTISLAGIVSTATPTGAALKCVQLVGNKSGLFFHSSTGPAGAAFHGGYLCLKPPTKRHAVLAAGGTGGSCSGVLQQDLNAYIASGADPALIAGKTVWLQAWARDPAAPFTDSLSDALSTTIAP